MRTSPTPALLVVLALVVAACGDDAAVTTTSAPVAASEATTTTRSAYGTTTIVAEATTTTIEAEADSVHVVVTIAAGDVTVTVDGTPLSGRVGVERGRVVRIELVSDVAEELHVHVYDHVIEAGPGVVGAVEFVADIPGIFEVERHFSGHVRVFDLQVG